MEAVVRKIAVVSSANGQIRSLYLVWVCDKRLTKVFLSNGSRPAMF